MPLHGGGATINQSERIASGGRSRMTTAADLIAYLVTKGCLPMVAGLQPLGAPPQGTLIPPQERAAMGFRGPGYAFRYETYTGALIADFGADSCTLRAADQDADQALQVLHSAITHDYADLAAQEGPDGADPMRTLRTYTARVTDKRYARITVAFPRLGAPVRIGFEVRVAGLEAIGRRAAAG